jgi:hypothetical protein
LNEEFAQLRQNDNPLVTTQAIVHSREQQLTDSIEFPDEIDNAMAIDPFTASKRPRSSNEDENSDKVKPQAKKSQRWRFSVDPTIFQFPKNCGFSS